MEFEKSVERDFFNAVESGKVTKVHECFKGIDIDCAQEAEVTPLMSACSGKHVSTVRYLLEQQADPARVDSDGNTPLHCALADRDSDKSKVYVIVDLLLRAGAHEVINQANKDGVTPLKLAQINDFYAAEQLIQGCLERVMY